MGLVSAPATLECSECGEEILEAGYVPATEREGEYDPTVEEAVCDACGFNEIGMMGCAPELEDVTEPDPGDVLLYVRATGGGLDVVSVKD